MVRVATCHEVARNSARVAYVPFEDRIPLDTANVAWTRRFLPEGGRFRCRPWTTSLGSG